MEVFARLVVQEQLQTALVKTVYHAQWAIIQDQAQIALRVRQEKQTVA